MMYSLHAPTPASGIRWRRTPGRFRVVILAVGISCAASAVPAAPPRPRSPGVPQLVLRRQLGEGDLLEAIAFSPDSRLLASGGEGGSVRLWQVAAGKPFRTLHGHREEITSLAFAPGGDRLVSGSKDRTLRLWNCRTWKTERVL